MKILLHAKVGRCAVLSLACKVEQSIDLRDSKGG